MENILNDIKKERARQDEKFGANRDQHPFLWLAILGEEVGEANKAAIDWHFSGKPLSEYREELIQVAAVAVAAIENIDARNKPKND